VHQPVGHGLHLRAVGHDGGSLQPGFLPPSEAATRGQQQSKYTDAHAIACRRTRPAARFITGNAAGTRFLVFETNQVQSGAGSTANNILGGTLGLTCREYHGPPFDLDRTA